MEVFLSPGNNLLQKKKIAGKKTSYIGMCLSLYIEKGDY